MKKIIVIFIIFCASITKAEFGIKLEYGREKITEINYTECLVKYRYDFKYFQIIPFGGWQTWFYNTGAEGHPVKDIYNIGSQLKIDSITFEFKHFCSHNVIADYNKYPIQPFIPEGNYTAISIKYEKWF